METILAFMTSPWVFVLLGCGAAEGLGAPNPVVLATYAHFMPDDVPETHAEWDQYSKSSRTRGVTHDE